MSDLPALPDLLGLGPGPEAVLPEQLLYHGLLHAALHLEALQLLLRDRLRRGGGLKEGTAGQMKTTVRCDSFISASNRGGQKQSPNLPYSKGVGSPVVALLIWWAS